MKKIILSHVILLLCWQNSEAVLRDPTQPVQYVENQTSAMTAGPLDLDLTLISENRQIVVINGLPLRIGDSISGARVMSIESNRVQLAGPSGNMTLFLIDQSVKKPVQ